LGKIVWAGCASHAAGQLRKPAGEEAEAKARVYAGWSELRESLRAAEPDVLVIFGTDHFTTFSYDLMPMFTIGRGERFESWGEFGSTQAVYDGVPDLSDALHADLVGAGFDLAGAVELKIDHSYSCPMTILAPDGGLPIVPITLTTFVPPAPTHARCVEFGRAAHEALLSQEIAERVAILGTGAISHWIGVPESGRVNSEFDRGFLEWFASIDLDNPGCWADDAYIQEHGGRGAYELRCWVAAAAAAGAASSRCLAYEPVADWLTGIAVLQLEPGSEAA
jgi:aromatic ring-opening dioxygenase catalytic subunit (LigB family)